jgi:hypothetical protein
MSLQSDELVASVVGRMALASGNPVACFVFLDSGFHRNDELVFSPE